ncbi:mCG148176 [Mus musculus]|nr:mCG148176 [Mus musculus]
MLQFPGGGSSTYPTQAGPLAHPIPEMSQAQPLEVCPEEAAGGKGHAFLFRLCSQRTLRFSHNHSSRACGSDMWTGREIPHGARLWGL